MSCRICNRTELIPVLDLGPQPWCNHFLAKEEVGHEPFYPLRLVFCPDCRTPQLDHTVPKEVMFGDHTYLSGVTRTLSDHFRGIAAELDSQFFQAAPRKSVCDIGSNDGTQLKHFQNLGWDVLGIESSKTTARIASEAGVPTLNAFFNRDVAQGLGRQFDVVNAAGVFFHLEELHSFTDGVRQLIGDQGIFTIQFLYMKRIVENLAFDQIYHEHLLYYNLHNVGQLLAMHGMEIFDAYVAPIHGGSVIAFACPVGARPRTPRLLELLRREDADRSNELETYEEFARRVARMKQDNLAYLRSQRQQGKRIWGFGAPVKGNTLLNYFGIGPDTIECLVEKNPLRRDKFAPGSHIPVRIESELEDAPDIYYVLAWNFKAEILKNNQALIERGVEFFFPVNPPEA